MRGRWILIFLAGFAVGFAWAFPMAANAAELVPLANRMPASHASAPLPAGFVSFCMRFAGQCETDKSKPARVALTAELWEQLDQVNQDVNRAIAPEDDLAHYGRAEYWTIPTDGKGDCEDYALTKREKLIAAGVSPRALRIALVRTSRGEGHAVLTVATDHGDYVLDNLAANVRSWDNTDYRWIERQDPDNEWAWVSLAPAAPTQAPLVASHG
ncbi:MAG TPA: transglutaminase-like cysteine peptidase [Rhizomicrobium sp.]|nr:transglutaminase-like cysteine peptidase [Rhizomicrobium sp.]